MFVPHGYWHMVVNIDECIALTHNYVSTSNLADCLRFLRDSPDQISGVRDRGETAVQPEEMYDIFVEKLRPMLSEDVLEAAIRDSIEKPGVDAGGRVSVRGRKSIVGGGIGRGGGLVHRRRRKRCVASVTDVGTTVSAPPYPSSKASLGFDVAVAVADECVSVDGGTLTKKLKCVESDDSLTPYKAIDSISTGQDSGGGGGGGGGGNVFSFSFDVGESELTHK